MARTTADYEEVLLEIMTPQLQSKNWLYAEAAKKMGYDLSLDRLERAIRQLVRDGVVKKSKSGPQWFYQLQTARNTCLPFLKYKEA